MDRLHGHPPLLDKQYIRKVCPDTTPSASACNAQTAIFFG
jgi:hypothetical protein